MSNMYCHKLALVDLELWSILIERIQSEHGLRYIIGAARLQRRLTEAANARHSRVHIIPHSLSGETSRTRLEETQASGAESSP
uniref:Uncharacterized protein n=1 Tax=Rhizophora mucronata TaxID=61149 RepID=A0A2P2NJ33_RHIMU